jgi:hypothetical protein
MELSAGQVEAIEKENMSKGKMIDRRPKRVEIKRA